MLSNQYRYLCSVKGHEGDVRGLCALPHAAGGFLSCSRDFTAKLWSSASDGNDFQMQSMYTGHQKFVLCVTILNSAKDIYPDGLILTGSSDSKINAYLPGSSEPIMSFVGHSNTVCALTTGIGGIIISGSWDKTAKMWLVDTHNMHEGKCTLTMEGHDAAVWDVLIMQGHEGIIITASADKSIKLWRAGECLRTFTGHTDCVRGLAALSSSEFLSCSNDASVKRWSCDGGCLQTYYGHCNYIYSITTFPNKSEFVTCGEDRTLKIWSTLQSNPLQSIPTPAQSSWKVVVLSNGDIAVGDSDATIRIFSNTRTSTAENKAAYEHELSTVAISPTGMNLGDLKADNLPGHEALEKSGEKDGQTLMIRNGSVIEAYQWSMADNKWVKVGDVVGSNSQGKRTMYQGQEYDYVFTIDLEEGKTSLHLPYNLTEDPWFAAQKFLDLHDLSQHFLDTVASFIIDNTKEADVQYQQNTDYVDPYTGQGRYTPASASSNSGTSSFDPFTGQGRYLPTSVPSSSGNGENREDPYTGGGRYIPTKNSNDKFNERQSGHDPMINPSRYIPGGNSDAKTKAGRHQYFPKTDYVFFHNKNIPAMLAKIREFAENRKLPLSNADLACLKNLTDQTSPVTTSEVKTLWDLLLWESDIVFPVLDLFRFSVTCQPDILRHICNTRAEELFEMLFQHLQINSTDVLVTNRILVLRIFCNMFASADGSAFLLAGCEKIINAIVSLIPVRPIQAFKGANDNVQIAVASLFINYAVLFNNKTSHSTPFSNVCDDARLVCVSCCLSCIASAKYLGPEAVFRHLVALGTLVIEHEIAQVSAQSLNFCKLVEAAAAVHSDVQKLVECSSYLLHMFE